MNTRDFYKEKLLAPNKKTQPRLLGILNTALSLIRPNNFVTT